MQAATTDELNTRKKCLWEENSDRPVKKTISEEKWKGKGCNLMFRIWLEVTYYQQGTENAEIKM